MLARHFSNFSEYQLNGYAQIVKMSNKNNSQQNLLVNDSHRRVGVIPTAADIFSNFSEYRFKEKNNSFCFSPNSDSPNFFKSLIKRNKINRLQGA